VASRQPLFSVKIAEEGIWWEKGVGSWALVPGARAARGWAGRWSPWAEAAWSVCARLGMAHTKGRKRPGSKGHRGMCWTRPFEGRCPYLGRWTRQRKQRRRDHPENKHGGTRWQKSSKALYHIGRVRVPTHRKISQVEAAVAGRMSWLLLTYSCTAGCAGPSCGSVEGELSGRKRLSYLVR
jgi:hypothetical protein